MRAVIYSRVSTRDKGQDPENQSRAIRAWALANGHEIVAEYSDHVSGSGKRTRPEFLRLMADAAAKKFDLVIVWALDRLTREGVARTFEYIQKLTTHDVQFASFTEEHFRTTGPAGELMIAVAAWIAKQERVRISERVTAGLVTAREKGSRGIMSKSGKRLAGNSGREPAIQDEAVVLEMRALRGRGLGIRAIAAQCGVKKSTAWRMLREAA